MFRSKEFRHKKTGAIVTQVLLTQIREYAELDSICKCKFPAPNCERDEKGVWFCKGCGSTVNQ